MLHKGESGFQIQQVELNTISASFACLSTVVTSVHQYLSDRLNFYNEISSMDIEKQALPENKSLDGIVEGIAQAHKLYGSHKYAFESF
jgi:hypothetical protein